MVEIHEIHSKEEIWMSTLGIEVAQIVFPHRDENLWLNKIRIIFRISSPINDNPVIRLVKLDDHKSLFPYLPDLLTRIQFMTSFIAGTAWNIPTISVNLQKLRENPALLVRIAAVHEIFKNSHKFNLSWQTIFLPVITI